MSQESVHKHLEILQGIIQRMAGNSFTIKGWAVALITGLFALAAAKENSHKLSLLLIGLIPVLSFWLLDSYYLWQEKLYRKEYDRVRRLTDKGTDFEINPLQHNVHGNTWWETFFTTTLLVFYLGLSLCAGALAFVLWWA